MLACRASAAPRLLWSTLISLLQLCGDSVRTEMRAGYSEQPEVQILGHKLEFVKAGYPQALVVSER